VGQKRLRVLDVDLLGLMWWLNPRGSHHVFPIYIRRPPTIVELALRTPSAVLPIEGASLALQSSLISGPEGCN
jgi:hypothetical protein